MPRIELNLNKSDDLKKVKAQWRVGPGLVPGEPNEGLKAQLLNSPARLPDYDSYRCGTRQVGVAHLARCPPCPRKTGRRREIGQSRACPRGLRGCPRCPGSGSTSRWSRPVCWPARSGRLAGSRR